MTELQTAATDENQKGFISEIFKRGYQWPIMVVCLLLSGVAMDLCVLLLASDSQGLAVKENYYELASNYEHNREQQLVNAKLGWKVEATIEPMTSFRSRVNLQLLDSKGAPISGAKIYLRVYHKAYPKGTYQQELSGSGGGKYQQEFPLRRLGIYQLEMLIDFDDKHFTNSVTANLWRK